MVIWLIVTAPPQFTTEMGTEKTEVPEVKKLPEVLV